MTKIADLQMQRQSILRSRQRVEVDLSEAQATVRRLEAQQHRRTLELNDIDRQILRAKYAESTE